MTANDEDLFALAYPVVTDPDGRRTEGRRSTLLTRRELSSVSDIFEALGPGDWVIRTLGPCVPVVRLSLRDGTRP